MNQKDRLSGRQREIIRLISRGKTDKEIAADLGIAKTTVRHHVTLLMARLNARSRSQAVMRFFCS